MTTKPHNPPAFPSTEDHPAYDIPMFSPGMTLRDWFAGQALTGVLASDPEHSLNDMEVAIAAFNVADAMLVEREK